VGLGLAAGAAAVCEAGEQGGCDNPPRKIPYYCLRPIHFGR
jgi:hypothetical protein